MENRIILTGSNLVLVTPEGNIYQHQDGNMELYNKLNNAQNENEIRQILMPEIFAKEQVIKEKIKEERLEVELIQSGFEALLATGDFEKVEDGTVYMKGIIRSLPKLLIKEFGRILQADEGRTDSLNYIALKRFWYWVCLNPRAEVSDDLYDFLEKNFMRINHQGFFYALRNVVKVSEDDSLTRFVSEKYTEIKLRKKGPKNYFVYYTGDGEKNYELHRGQDSMMEIADYVGNLEELYLDLPNMEQNRYTDAHTKTFDIRVGQKVSMPMEDCNWNRADCGHAGLHFTMDQINYVGCGDTSVIVLINPINFVA